MTTTFSQQPAIELVGVRKAFAAQEVLHGIDLAVARGQIYGYIGPNGAGKTTTVRILAGTLTGFEGTARVAGIDVREDPLAVKRRIGYLPENAQLYDALTVLEHLLLVGRLHGLDDDLIQERGCAILDGFDLLPRADSRLGSLSKGMRQKVMFTAALLHDPDVLFLDEPLSGLDVHAAVVIKELMHRLAQGGKTILYCSHVMDVVERMCDRIAVIDGGRLVAEGTFEELGSASQQGGTLERIFLELTHGGEAPERARRIAEVLVDGKAPA